MSVRPQMHLVFGVDDFNGEFNTDIYETQLHVLPDGLPRHEYLALKDTAFDRRTGEWKWICDVLYHGGEFNPGVLGLKLASSGCDSDLVRALSLFHPEYDTSGKRDILVWKKSEHPAYVRRLSRPGKPGDLPAYSDIDWQWSWFYPAVIEQHFMWPVHAYVARWLFRFIGVDTDHRQFKAMLVWQWS